MVQGKPLEPANLPALLLALSFTTGLIDAISVLGLGRVFTANMTGNVVFLGFAAAGAPGFRWTYFVVAIAFFLIGAIASGRIGHAYADRPLHLWLRRSAWLEACLMMVAALVSIGFASDQQDPAWKAYAMILLTAVAMGFRNGTVRQLRVPDLTTTVLTLTLTGIGADSKLAGGENSNLGRRLAAIGTMFIGALIGAYIVMNAGLTMALVVASALPVLATYTFVRPDVRVNRGSPTE